MADCLNCNNCISKEVYDGERGMFIYDRKCSAGVFVIKDGKINPWDMSCENFELGKRKIIPMTEDEKQKY